MSEIKNPPVFHGILTEINKPITKLSVIVSMLDAFENNKILYCHWKSNEHLHASMAGDTDLDILFDYQQKKTLELTLKKLGFKKFVSISQKQYHDIEDYLILDDQSGKVVHLHAHFKLTVGEPYIKSYQLDYEMQILNSRVFNKFISIYCINPSFELVLLYIREALKLRHRDRLMMFLKNKILYNKHLVKEYTWLLERSSNLEIETLTRSLFSNHKPVYNLLTSDFNRHTILQLASIIKKEYKNKRLYSSFNALAIRWYREVFVKVKRKWSRLFGQPVLSKRVHPLMGQIVAVIGADGSGKSTVIADLQHTFKQKLDVYKIYFGRGDGRSSFLRKSLTYLKKAVSKNRKEVKSQNKTYDEINDKTGFATNLYKCIHALLVAFEKERNFKLMQAAKKKGMLVICDRFPQNQFYGFNDGPLISNFQNSRNPFFKAASNLEKRIYNKADTNQPDLLFKLIADADIVAARKPGETSLSVLEKKITATRNLKLNDSCKVITVDATQPLKEVLFILKKNIWNAYA